MILDRISEAYKILTILNVQLLLSFFFEYVEIPQKQFFGFLTPKTFRNRSKSVGDGLGVFFPTFSTFLKKSLFWPFWPCWAYKMSRLGPKMVKMAIFDHFWPFLGFKKCGTPLKVFACVPETLGGYLLRSYEATRGPEEAFWVTTGPI